ncbi:hypothetical protein [Bacillus andreraoultii]|uniref:hypothetical protein n=1 Tax=Bacillus andreraoultii TaxID=1499685 RepID=UPI00053B03D8|nr:hypothetical protein [Bacillus andreraoultii]
MNLISILLYERNLQFWNIPFQQEHGEVNPIPGSPLEEFIFNLPEEIEEYFIHQKEGNHLYDFGDEWIFTIVVKQILEQDSELLTPYVKEKGEKGQYEDWSW